MRTVRTVMTGERPDHSRYRDDPVGFARDVLRVTLTPDQAEFLAALLTQPYRVMVKSGHNVGKTFSSAVAVLWWFYTRSPAVVITTAPTDRDVKDLLWTEVRLLARRAGLPNDFIGESAAEMRVSEDHYAKGYTAQNGESFQGRHRANMLFVFDEAEGVVAVFWKVAETMFHPDGTHGFLAILNPTTTTSQSYQEEQAVDAEGSPKWQVFTVSSLNHPNIVAACRNEPAPIPNAVSIEQVRTWMGDWFEPVEAADMDPDRDVEFPPESRKWWRPGPDGEARVLGRRPSAGTFGVWSEYAWRLATARTAAAGRTEIDPGNLPEVGCDVARFGDDRTEIHWRFGPVSLGHEDHGGWDTVRTAGRLMELAGELARLATLMRPPQAEPVDPKIIRIKVDDTGVGGGVTDILRSEGFNVIPVNAGEAAAASDKYPRVRDELWFGLAARAKEGRLDLSRLPPARLAKLKVQALAPTWAPTVDRRRKVEAKEDTKKRIGRSPDGMDAVNLAYYETGGPDGGVEWIPGPERRTWRDRQH